MALARAYLKGAAVVVLYGRLFRVYAQAEGELGELPIEEGGADL